MASQSSFRYGRIGVSILTDPSRSTRRRRTIQFDRARGADDFGDLDLAFTEMEPSRRSIDRLSLSAARSSSSVLLRRGALDVRRPRTLRAVGNLELDSITLAQICDALATGSALVKEIF